MRVGYPRRATFTFEVDLEFAPHIGDRYWDNQGRAWTTREAREGTIALRNPLPTHRIYEITLESQHGAFRLDGGEHDLIPCSERRSGDGWSGQIEAAGSHENPREPPVVMTIRGFGTVVQGEQEFSWILRMNDGRLRLQVGPHVRGYNHFAGPTFFEREWSSNFAEARLLPWREVADRLDDFMGAM